MEYTKLGNTDIEISKLCVGCMSFGKPSADQHEWTLNPQTRYISVIAAIIGFCSSAVEIVHPTNPLHLIFSFECFGYTLMLCHLFYQTSKHFFCLLVNVNKVIVLKGIKRVECTAINRKRAREKREA